MVTAESDGEFVVITIRCDNCEGGILKIATPHIETLARVLPKICEAAGINLADGVTETHVFDVTDDEAKQKAEAFFAEFVKRRTEQN
jgi:hypothetical protein